MHHWTENYCGFFRRFWDFLKEGKVFLQVFFTQKNSFLLTFKENYFKEHLWTLLPAEW